jgi:transposase
MSHKVKYIGMDVHKEAIVIAVLNDTGKLVMETMVETKASSILQFIHGLRGELHGTWEEGTWAAWLYDLLQPQVQQVVVCNPRRNALLKEGSKSDKGDARKLADLLRTGMLRPCLPRRKWTTDVARVGAQLSDHQQRFNQGDESTEGTVSRLGYSRWRHPGLGSALPGGMVE